MLCDYIGFSCFHNAMQNTTRLTGDCAVGCPDDCEAVKFFAASTVDDYAEERTILVSVSI